MHIYYCNLSLLVLISGGPKSSLRNGTRMVVVKMMDRVLECEVAVGTQRGLRVFLPRIPMHDKSNELPFTIVRRQFPVRLAFCLTINKVIFFISNLSVFIQFIYFRAKVKVKKGLGCIFLPLCLLMDSSTQGSVVEEERLMFMFSLATIKMGLLIMWCILSS